MKSQSTEIKAPDRWPYLCICLLDWEPRDFQKTHPCSDHNRSRQCYRCTSGTPPSGGCSSPLRWGRCCHCTGTGGRASRGHCYPGGLQSSRHHRAHISYLGMRQSIVTKENTRVPQQPSVSDSYEGSRDLAAAVALSQISGGTSHTSLFPP